MREGHVDAREVDSDRVNVGVAEYRVTDDDLALATSGLGSCIAVLLHHERSGVSGLGHFMLPSMPEQSDNGVAKYVDTGVEAMVEEMELVGANRAGVVAKIAGGSTLLPGLSDDDPIGPRNVEEAERVFEALNIPIVARDVGEDYGRSVEFDPDTQTMTVLGARAETVRL